MLQTSSVLLIVIPVVQLLNLSARRENNYKISMLLRTLKYESGKKKNFQSRFTSVAK